MVKAIFAHIPAISLHGAPQVWRSLQSQWRLWRQPYKRSSDPWDHCRFSWGTSVLYSYLVTVVTISCCAIGIYMFHSLSLLQNHTRDQFGKPSHVLPQRLHEMTYKIICILLHLYFSEGKCHPFHQILKVVCHQNLKNINQQSKQTAYHRR